jgi:hypothetical protein
LLSFINEQWRIGYTTYTKTNSLNLVSLVNVHRAGSSHQCEIAMATTKLSKSDTGARPW